VLHYEILRYWWKPRIRPCSQVREELICELSQTLKKSVVVILAPSKNSLYFRISGVDEQHTDVGYGTCFVQRRGEGTSHWTGLHGVTLSILSYLSTVFAFYFCRSMLCKRGLCCHAVSVRPSRSWIMSKRINIGLPIFKNFSPSSIVIPFYTVSQKNEPLRSIWHNFTNSPCLLIIFGTEKPYSIPTSIG